MLWKVSRWVAKRYQREIERGDGDDQERSWWSALRSTSALVRFQSPASATLESSSLCKLPPHPNKVAKSCLPISTRTVKAITHTLSPGLSSCVYSLIIVFELPPAPAARGEFGASSFLPAVKAAALRLVYSQMSQYTLLLLKSRLEGVRDEGRKSRTRVKKGGGNFKGNPPQLGTSRASYACRRSILS